MFETGVFHTSALENRGISRSKLYESVAAGNLIRLRRGWYALPHAPADIALAVRQGVRLTCISAAEHHGLWTPPHTGLHVFGVHGRTRGLSASIVHPQPHLRRWPDNEPIASLDLALLHAGHCLPVSDAAILFESALCLGRISLADARAIVNELPYHRRVPLGRIRPEAQSGTETKVRWFLESRGVHVQAQAFIEGVGRVDLLVGKSLVIECDSVRYHSDPRQYHEDRRRDAELIRLGYQPIRLTWQDVFLRWKDTRRRLEGILARRRHRYLRPNTARS